MNKFYAIELAAICGIAVFIITIYSIFVLMFTKSSRSPQIKPKSPLIVLVSTVGNALSLLVIGIMIIASIFSDANYYYYIMNTCISLSETVFSPLMYYSYLFRIIQLTRIFHIPNLPHEKMDTSSKWFKQKVYVVIAGIIFSISLVICSILIHICLYESFYNYFFHPFIIFTTLTINFIFLFLLSISAILVLSNRMYTDKIKIEVVSLVSFWICCNFGSYYLIMLINDIDYIKSAFLELILPELIMLLRNMITFMLSIMAPVMQYRAERITPFGETRECVNNVEMALCSELPFIYFFEFIESLDGIHGKNVINVYIEIKLYEDAIINNDMDTANQIVEEILADYLDEMGEYRVQEIPAKIKKLIKSNAKSNKNNLHLFDRLNNVIMLKLENYFTLFKNSILYKCLYRELRNTEVIYERLLNSELI